MDTITEHPLATSPIAARILSQVPEFIPSYAELFDQEAHHPSDGTVLARLAEMVGEVAAEEPFPYELVARCFETVEELLEEGPSCGSVQVADPAEEDRSEVVYSFLGNLPVTAITAGLMWMGPRMLDALESFGEDGEADG